MQYYAVTVFLQNPSLDNPIYIVKADTRRSLLPVIDAVAPLVRAAMEQIGLPRAAELNWVADPTVTGSWKFLYNPVCPRDVVPAEVLNARLFIERASHYIEAT